MIISDEQVRLAVEYLQTSERQGAVEQRGGDEIAPELLARVRDIVSTIPDTRDDRVEQAREMLAGIGPSSSEVAEKMIGRIVSDSLR